MQSNSIVMTVLHWTIMFIKKKGAQNIWSYDLVHNKKPFGYRVVAHHLETF